MCNFKQQYAISATVCNFSNSMKFQQQYAIFQQQYAIFSNSMQFSTTVCNFSNSLQCQQLYAILATVCNFTDILKFQYASESKAVYTATSRVENWGHVWSFQQKFVMNPRNKNIPLTPKYGFRNIPVNPLKRRPCTNQYRSAPFNTKNIIYLCYKIRYLSREVNCTEPSLH